MRDSSWHVIREKFPKVRMSSCCSGASSSQTEATPARISSATAAMRSSRCFRSFLSSGKLSFQPCRA